MSVYSSRLSAAISHASSWSSTIRMRFFSLLEFIIPFCSLQFYCVSCRRYHWAFFLSLSAGEISAKSEKIGRRHSSAGLLIAFKSPQSSQCLRRQASIGGELEGFQGVAVYSSSL